MQVLVPPRCARAGTYEPTEIFNEEAKKAGQPEHGFSQKWVAHLFVPLQALVQTLSVEQREGEDGLRTRRCDPQLDVEVGILAKKSSGCLMASSSAQTKLGAVCCRTGDGQRREKDLNVRHRERKRRVSH